MLVYCTQWTLQTVSWRCCGLSTCMLTKYLRGISQPLRHMPAGSLCAASLRARIPNYVHRGNVAEGRLYIVARYHFLSEVLRLCAIERNRVSVSIRS